ncbi:Cell division suppressor protein YneA [Frondihabitans sp. 762G35]|uniref:LysM peptidoglycan-binding domain-containing protein n=1 Tax=Frondihabitans sp. 762G35 TaxID=1446794 RepID=UPI000D226CCC|nr:LysM peptidoglycan-binding domain-containing protein [Frondihabitans sp. 762G35]ARC56574.1 Cell division suppressor protein YneA [Frondihabitans sp. 762G35]
MSATITAFPRSSSRAGRGPVTASRPASGRAVYFTPDESLVGAGQRATSEQPAARQATAAQNDAVHGVPRPHLHITRRGRVVLTLLTVVGVLVIMASFLLAGQGAVATSTAGDTHFQEVTVASGETLWQVAQEVAPAADPRDVIADISSLNNLDGSQVQAGQTLAIPTKYTR